MLILVFSLVALVIIFFYMFYSAAQDLRSMESEKKYWIGRYGDQTLSTSEWIRRYDERCDKIWSLQKEVAALQKQLKALTPETPQAPWWTEED